MALERTGDTAKGAEALAKAVRLLRGQTRTAELLGVSQPTVWRWLKARRSLPAEHIEIVSFETGMSKQELRPDLPWDEAGSAIPALPPISTIDPAQ